MSPVHPPSSPRLGARIPRARAVSIPGCEVVRDTVRVEPRVTQRQCVGRAGVKGRVGESQSRIQGCQCPEIVRRSGLLVM